MTPAIINSGDTTQVSITVTNPNTATTITRAGTAFTDTYPTAFTNTNPASVTINCSGGSSASVVGGVAAGATIGMSNMSLAPGGSCTVTSLVTGTSGTVPTTGANTTGVVTFDNAPAGSAATAGYTITNLAEPVITKAFANLAISAGASVALTFTLTNPGGNGASPVTGAAFVDNFPLGLTAVTTGAVTFAPAGCAGTATVSANAFTVSGLNIPANAPRTCTAVIQVTATAQGSYFNSTGSVTSTVTPTQTVPGTATLAAYRGLDVTKAFGTGAIAAGTGTTSLTITITNPSGNPGVISASSIIDNFPASIQVATGGTGAVNAGCVASGTSVFDDGVSGGIAVNIGNGDTAIRLQNYSIAVGTPCVITIDLVRMVTSGTLTNTVDTIQSARAQQGVFPATLNGTSGSAQLSAGKVGISKAFSPASINIGGTSTLTFTLNNTSAVAVAGINFTDLLTNSSPTTRQLTLASGVVGGTCTGVVSNATSGGTSFVVTAGNVPASSSCTITVQVTSAVSGINPNQTTGVTHAADPAAGPVSNTATLTVIPPPVVTKSFLPSQVGPGLRSTLSVTVTNTNPFPVTLSALTDAFPTGLVVAAPVITSNACGGTLRNVADSANLAAGDTGFLLKNGNVATNSSCVIAISVSAATAGSYVNTIDAGALTSDAGSNVNPTTATLTVLLPLTVVKTFTPNSIAAGGVSVLLVRLTNPNSVAVTGAGFADTYPANLNNTSSPAGATSCPGGSVTAASNGASLALSGATVPASNFCDVTVNVTSAVSGVRTNPAFGVTTTNAGTATSGAATLSVGVPSMTKTFSPNPVSVGGVSTISFVISNPAAAPMTNVGFIDTFPAGMTLAYAPATPQCGGTLYLANGTTTPPPAGGGSVRLGSSTGTNGGSIATSGSCTIAVAVTTASSGVRVNLTGAVTAGASIGNTATDSLTTLAPPVASKSFSPSTVGANQVTVVTVRLDNPNAFVISGVAFTDTYPATVVNAASPAGATTCASGSVSAVAGVGSMSLSGAIVPASGFCLVTANVIASTAGALVNTIPVGSVTSTNAGSNTTLATAGLLVLAPPLVQKDFIGPNYASFGLSGTTMPLNTPTVMRIRLTNTTSSAAITGVALSDAYPSGLINSTPPNAAIAGAGCTGTLSAAAGGTSLDISGMTIPPGITCTISVNVQSAISNFYTNNTGPVSTGNAGAGVATSGSIYVMAPVVVTKAFTPNFVSNGATVTAVGLTVINPNPYPVTNAAIVDNYDSANILNATSSGPVSAPPLFSGTGCSGTVATGGSSVNLTNGTVPANGSCSISIFARVSAVGDQINCTDTISSANAGNGTNVCATVNRGATATSVPPTIAKSFIPAGIAVNGLSTLSFTVTNPNTAGVGIITSTSFVDALPAGLSVATPAVVSNTCGGTWNATAGSTIINLTGGTVATNSSCVVSVQVTGNTPGIFTNVSGVVTASTGTGNQATAVLTILDPPEITKSFTPSSISQGGVSTISFVISNVNSSAITNMAFTDTLTGMSIVNPPAPLVTGAGCTGFAVTAPSGGSLITVGGANSVPARVGVTPGTCTITVQVTSSVAGVWPNATSQTTSNAGTGAGSNTVSLTVNQVTVGVSGYVFGDLNANGVRNPLTEDWSAGVLVYVNIVSGGAVVQSQAVNAGTGFFNFPAVPYGNYTIIVSDSPTNITPVIPSGFNATAPTTASWNLPITGGVPPVVDFGFTLPALSQVSGRVFRDSGIAAGIPNNGILDSGEGGSSPGIAGVTVIVTNCSTITYGTTTTDGSGTYFLRFPSTATNVCIIENNISGTGSASSGAANPIGLIYLSTGASSSGSAITAGTCASPPGGGAVEYDRANDRICFQKTSGTYVSYANLNFGDVPPNTFVPDGQQQTTPGGVVNYPHVFTFETGGSVTFGTTVVATQPNLPGWNEVLYRDTDCDGKIEGAGDIVLAPTTPVTVAVPTASAPGNKICVVLRQFTPPSAPFGAQRVVRVDAGFTYTNSNTAGNSLLYATYSRNDTTTIGDKSSAAISLVKEVCNETTSTCTDNLIDQSSLAGNGNYTANNTAKTGDVLRYRIIYANTSGTVAGGGVSNLVINDATPPFTTLNGAPACVVTPPAPASCTPSTVPPLGVRWTIGSVSGGGQGIVLYRVTVQ